MALRGIQEYIARDVNNIARVEDEGNIVSIKGNIFLYPPKKSHSIATWFNLFSNVMSRYFLFKHVKSDSSATIRFSKHKHHVFI